VDQAYRRMEALFHVSQKFVEASDENQVIEPVLRLMVELTGAQGAAFAARRTTADRAQRRAAGLRPGWSIRPQKCGALRSAKCEPLGDRRTAGAARPFENGAGLPCLPVRRERGWA
jgi:hypothetical protein